MQLALPIDTTLNQGRYQIRQVLGQGGFGVSYLAYDSQLGQPVAIKEHFPWGCLRNQNEVVPGQLSPAEYTDSLRRFQRESRHLKRLHHPGIVAVHHDFPENETAYLVLDWVEGRPLQFGDPLKSWLPQVCQSLDYLHANQLIHGDLKPANILIHQNGHPILIDFGNSRPSLTPASSLIVSHGYSPPELYSQQQVWGPATDIYALAACVVEVQSGKPPPSALDRWAGTPLPPGLHPTLVRALDLDPQKRLKSLKEFEQTLLGPQPSVALTLPRHAGWVYALVSSPQGSMLASAGEDRRICVLDSQTSETHTWGTHSSWVRALGFLDEERLLGLGQDGRLGLYTHQGLQNSLKLPSGCLALKLAGQKAWVGDQQGRIHQVNLNDLSHEHSWQAARGAIQGLDCDGKILACASGEERIPLWDVTRGELLEQLKGHSAPVRCVALAGSLLYSGGADRRLLQWDWAEGRPDDLGQCQGCIWAVHPHPVGILTGDGAKNVCLWPYNSHIASHTLGQHQGEVRALALLPLRGLLCSAGQDGQVLGWPLPQPPSSEPGRRGQRCGPGSG